MTPEKANEVWVAVVLGAVLVVIFWPAGPTWPVVFWGYIALLAVYGIWFLAAGRPGLPQYEYKRPSLKDMVLSVALAGAAMGAYSIFWRSPLSWSTVVIVGIAMAWGWWRGSPVRRKP